MDDIFGLAAALVVPRYLTKPTNSQLRLNSLQWLAVLDVDGYAMAG